MLDSLKRERADVDGFPSVAWFWTCTAAEALCFGLAERRRELVKGGGMVKGFFSVDVRDALRSLRATPLVTFVAVVSLALGIGANTALFSILNSVLLKTLPVHEPERLALVSDYWTNPIWEQIRERRHQLFENAFAWSGTRFNVSPTGPTDFVDGAWASGEMFDVLGVHAIIGRTLTAADDVRGGGPDGPVAVISHRFWERRFGSAPDVLEKSIPINGIPVRIVGVLPRGFFGPDVGRSADLIAPIGILTLVRGNPDALDQRSSWWLEIMARLKPGQTVERPPWPCAASSRKCARRPFRRTGPPRNRRSTSPSR
jgi:hypothetical protein